MQGSGCSPNFYIGGATNIFCSPNIYTLSIPIFKRIIKNIYTFSNRSAHSPLSVSYRKDIHVHVITNILLIRTLELFKCLFWSASAPPI